MSSKFFSISLACGSADGNGAVQLLPQSGEGLEVLGLHISKHIKD